MNNKTVPANFHHDRIIEWAMECLSSLGCTLKSSVPEIVQHTTDIIRVLRDRFHQPVPEIIAHDKKLCCFLMKDAGRKLREILKQKFDVNLACRAVSQFASFQSSVTGHLDDLFELGVPDWRLERFPRLYSEVLEQKDLLEADGLSGPEIASLAALIPKVSSLCKKLSGYLVRQTIVQPDFNDNNILINDVSGRLTVIDLGEIAISHPFFSMINFLHQMKKHHDLKEEDDTYARIRDCYLQDYMGSQLGHDMLDAFSIAEALSPVYGIFAVHRLIVVCGEGKIAPSLHGKLSGSLRESMRSTQI